MEVFKLHHDLVNDYAAYTKSFVKISDVRDFDKALRVGSVIVDQVVM